MSISRRGILCNEIKNYQELTRTDIQLLGCISLITTLKMLEMPTLFLPFMSVFFFIGSQTI